MKVKKDKNNQMDQFCENLMRKYDYKEKEILSLKEEIEKMNNKHTLTLSRLNQLSIIQESK